MDKIKVFLSFMFFPLAYFLIPEGYKNAKKYYVINVALFVFLQALMIFCSVASYSESYFKVQMLFVVLLLSAAPVFPVSVGLNFTRTQFIFMSCFVFLAVAVAVKKSIQEQFYFALFLLAAIIIFCESIRLHTLLVSKYRVTKIEGSNPPQ